MYDTIIVGSGCAGATVARKFADAGKKVLVLERRGHIAGNCYDEKDKIGVMIHRYGPHIFHTNNKEVVDFLSRFTKWHKYEHEVLARVNGEYIPVPFNLNTLYMVYDEKRAAEIEKKLIDTYGEGNKVPIMKLRENNDADIREVAEYVYNNIFLKYTMKQWGQTPSEVDQSVTARVPVVISYDNRYFHDTYQMMPEDGFTAMFKNMLDSDNIEVRLNTDAKEILQIKDNKIYFEGQEYTGQVFYTGQTDELFDYEYGHLPYRSLNFEFESYDNMEYYQPKAVINYTVDEDYTRITEFKHLLGQRLDGTTIIKEYSVPYEGKKEQIPYYSIINEENLNKYRMYKERADKITNLHLVGRLAEYKYYNIDAIIARALEVSDRVM
ncbi:MAG: UDP-galactopyranose mutase [Lachnospiraceae bacterium]|uniref:UDP-galactopyranose mutase n=1 Tax=Falcatimonas sp. MSJ-15 TaxID=2841515 RepID=UPI001C1007F3|nr:UDP-galactopyranose mutase [Falcatimonas sp. MSJ-15]MBU5469042.1 UDP-galactopyranose mutase [Falcatimonas sp. MSJ-15]MEE0959290.1 UDP-galactopyranose mutase [Lachnospiraceae bacterium]